MHHKAHPGRGRMGDNGLGLAQGWGERFLADDMDPAPGGLGTDLPM